MCVPRVLIATGPIPLRRRRAGRETLFHSGRRICPGTDTPISRRETRRPVTATGGCGPVQSAASRREIEPAQGTDFHSQESCAIYSGRKRKESLRSKDIDETVTRRRGRAPARIDWHTSHRALSRQAKKSAVKGGKQNRQKAAQKAAKTRRAA